MLWMCPAASPADIIHHLRCFLPMLPALLASAFSWFCFQSTSVSGSKICGFFGFQKLWSSSCSKDVRSSRCSVFNCRSRTSFATGDTGEAPLKRPGFSQQREVCRARGCGTCSVPSRGNDADLTLQASSLYSLYHQRGSGIVLQIRPLVSFEVALVSGAESTWLHPSKVFVFAFCQAVTSLKFLSYPLPTVQSISGTCGGSTRLVSISRTRGSSRDHLIMLAAE